MQRPKTGCRRSAASPARAFPCAIRKRRRLLGVLCLTDAFAALPRGDALDLAALMRKVPVVSDRADALDVIEILRASVRQTQSP